MMTYRSGVRHPETGDLLLAGSTGPDGPSPVELRGARIRDDDCGLIYEATVNRGSGKVWLTSLSIHTTHEGQRIDQDTIRRAPVQRIADQVADILAQWDDPDGYPVDWLTHGAPPPTGARPSPQQVATDWESGLRRKDIAHKYGVSLHAVDKWLKESRDADLIPQATTGRPRKTSGPIRTNN